MPGLHISLGVFYRLFTLLETACHQLDLALSTQGKQDDTRHSYRLYCEALSILTNLEEERNHNEEEAQAAEQISTFLAVSGADQQHIEFCRQSVAELRRKVDNLVSMSYHKLPAILPHFTGLFIQYHVGHSDTTAPQYH